MGGEGGGSDCVKVAIRCRPPSQKEINNNEPCIVEMQEAFGEEGDSGQVELTDPSGHDEPSKFAFDIVFGLSVLQSQIYSSIGRPALMKTFEGYNGTIFAYGQTGSGKSWTMTGGAGDLRGIIPRVCEELFEQITEMQANSTRKFLVMCSFFEIYNEIIFDLLNPVADRGKLGGGLQIKEHPVMGIYVKDLTELVAEDAGKLEAMLDNGSKNRAVSSTLMNSVSSRSHSIFTIKVHQKDEEDSTRNVFAKLNLVDLAGSERQKGTGASGQTLKEGANINKSLSALGNVINALVETANGKKVFIPYRNSKLTRVLQESLGGNSLCTMLATLSPAACNYEETMSTLRYANRAKAIKVSATKNEEASQISRLKAEVEELKKKLASGGGGGGVGLTDAEREAERLKFEKQLKEMEKMMSNNWEDKAKLSEAHEKQMQKLAEERRKAAQALEEERAKRLRLLQEKNDLELSIRGFLDLVSSMPKFNTPPAVLTGDVGRLWLKTYRALRQKVEELSNQRTLVLVFKHAFDEDVKLWGEGAEASDIGLASTGLNRCLPKLNKLRKGGAKLLQLEGESLAAAAELSEGVRQAIAELAIFTTNLGNQATTDQPEGSAASEEAAEDKANVASALEELQRMLGLLQKQAQEKLEELGRLACIEMGQTCDIVLRVSEACLAEGPPDAHQHVQALKAFIVDPSLASLPPGMPAKPLQEYEPHEVKDTPETTEAVLGQIIRWDGLCGGKSKKSASELLTRPPPKFLLDVTVAVKAATGFPAGIDENWPEARDDRLARFQQIAEAVSSVLGITLDFDGVDVLKGKEVPKTLRLLQLLAIAAARSRTIEATQITERAPGVARACELPSIIDAMDRCIQGAKELVDAQRAAAEMDSNEAGSLEAKIAELQRQLAKETSLRLAQEEALADAERVLQETLAAVKNVSTECELTQVVAHPADADAEQVELERQLQELQTVTQSDGSLPEDCIARMLSQQLLELRRELEQSDADIRSLKQKQEELGASVAEALSQARRVEAQVQRERERKETERELSGQSPEEQKMILQAHENKLRTKAESLEAQLVQLQTEAEERRLANQRLRDEKDDLASKAEDANLQIQIVQEERDAIREAYEQLWNEKATLDEEIQMQETSYVDLSERLSTLQDENEDLVMLVDKKLEQIAELQRNGF